MLEAGLLREVTELAPRLGRNAQAAVGYRQLLAVVRGELAYNLGVEAVRKATLSLARRQRTFFRRDPRIRWVPWSASVADLGRVVREALLS
jgi:tRNA dimethylallyltransferase